MFRLPLLCLFYALRLFFQRGSLPKACCSVAAVSPSPLSQGITGIRYHSSDFFLTSLLGRGCDGGRDRYAAMLWVFLSFWFSLRLLGQCGGFTGADFPRLFLGRPCGGGREGSLEVILPPVIDALRLGIQRWSSADFASPSLIPGKHVALPGGFGVGNLVLLPLPPRIRNETLLTSPGPLEPQRWPQRDAAAYASARSFPYHGTVVAYEPVLFGSFFLIFFFWNWTRFPTVACAALFGPRVLFPFRPPPFYTF